MESSIDPASLSEHCPVDGDDSDDMVDPDSPNDSPILIRIVLVGKKHVMARTKERKWYDLSDNHAIEHPPIKRRRNEDGPDSVGDGQGMRLSLANTLKHTGCGIH